jgi:predicted metalloprotease
MRMDGQEESGNVHDVRGSSGGGRGGFGGLPIGGRGIGIGTVVVALIGGWIFGINPLTLLGMFAGGGDPQVVQQQERARAPAATGADPTPATDPQVKFVSRVLRSTEQVWTPIFKQAGKTYQPAQLYVFSGGYSTACGYGQAAMGPFYCPGDQSIYIDLRFFQQLEKQLGAPGEFAQAYVVAHEVGHHVQKLMGVMERTGSRPSNDTSVRTELMADCFAGVWAAAAQKVEGGWRFSPGDIEAGLNAASKIGDDMMQRRQGGSVVPESFTHGSSAQRVQWFRRGLESGSVDSCNTFGS